MVGRDLEKLRLIQAVAADVTEAVEHLASAEGVADDIKAAALEVAAEVYSRKMTQEMMLAILKASMTKAGL